MSIVQSRPKKKNSLRYTYGGTKRRKPIVDEDAEIARTGEIGQYFSSRFYAVPIVRDKAEIQPTRIEIQPKSLANATSEPIEIESPSFGSSYQPLREILERASQQSRAQIRQAFKVPILGVQQRLQSAIREAVKLPKPMVLRMPEFKIVMPTLKLIDTSTIKVIKGPILDTEAFQRTFRDVFAQQVQITRNAIKMSIAIPDAQLSVPDQQIDNLLALLRSGLELPSDEAICAVLEIQLIPVGEAHLYDTVHLLVQFIRKHRSTNSPKVLIAVGAAIRKVLLNLPKVDLSLAVDLMKSEGSLAVPIAVELEVAKMVVQRVVEDPSIQALQFPELAEAMLCNAKLYSSAKMVNREFYNATALNSVLACVLMRVPESQSIATQIMNDSPNWFSRLCSNRLKRICAELLSRDDSNALDLLKHINSLPFITNGDQKGQGGSGS